MRDQPQSTSPCTRPVQGPSRRLLYLAPIVTSAVSDPRWREWIEQVSPMTAGLAVQATLRLDTLPISPWRGLGVVALYAAASTAAAAVALRFRDA